MATPGELVHVVASVLGIPEATVVQYDRNLVAAGLRTKAGRGRSAARVTSQDAANLLIAIGGAPVFGASLIETCNTCERYGTLKVLEMPRGFSKVKLQLPTFGKVVERHSVREAIAALIDSIAAGEFGGLFLDRHLRQYSWVRITFLGPSPRVQISLNYRGAKAMLFFLENDEFPSEYPDLGQFRSFGFATLAAMARLIGTEAKAN